MGQYEIVLDFLQRYKKAHPRSFSGRKIAIWGAGKYGRLACCALTELQIACDCFIDSDAKKTGSILLGLPICTPKTVLENAETEYFIIAALASDDEVRRQITEACGDKGLHLMMCSEIRAEMPINRIRLEYNSKPESIPLVAPVLGERYKNDGMRILPLDGIQEKALGDFLEWYTSGDSRASKAEISCLCGSSNFTLLAEKDRHGIPVKTVLCRECGLVMQNPRMCAAGFEYFYEKFFADIAFPAGSQPPEELFFWRKQDASPQIHDALKDFLTPESEILEIGCAAGSVVEYFAELGYKATGIDLDERYISYGRSRGLDLHYCNSKDFLAQNEKRFDVIILEHVLEHLVDLESELSIIKGLLKPGGYIYIGVPGIKGFNLEYHRFDFLDSLQIMHLFYWTRDTFLQTMAWFGLRAVKCDEYISAVMQVGETVHDKSNFTRDILQFLLHLEKHRLSLQKGIYIPELN